LSNESAQTAENRGLPDGFKFHESIHQRFGTNRHGTKGVQNGTASKLKIGENRIAPVIFLSKPALALFPPDNPSQGGPPRTSRR